MLSSPSTLIILIESEFEVLQPLDLLVAVVLRTLGADHVLQHNTTILVELIAPVTVCAVAEINQIFRGETLVGRICDFLD